MTLENITETITQIAAALAPILAWVCMALVSNTKLKALASGVATALTLVTGLALTLQWMPEARKTAQDVTHIPMSYENNETLPEQVPTVIEPNKPQAIPVSEQPPAPQEPRREQPPEPPQPPAVPTKQPPNPQEKAMWMREAKNLLDQNRAEPNSEEIKALVSTGLNGLSTLFVTQRITSGETPEIQILLRWKNPFQHKEAFNQQHLSTIITGEITRSSALIPDENWKNISLIYLGRQSPTGPLEVLMVDKIRKFTGNPPDHRRVFTDAGLPQAPPLKSLLELPPYSEIDTMVKRVFQKDLVKTNIPLTSEQPIVLEMGLNTNAATRDEQIKKIRENAEILRKEILDKFGYIPQIILDYKQKGEDVLVLTLGRTETGSEQEKNVHLIKAHPMLERIWEP